MWLESALQSLIYNKSLFFGKTTRREEINKKQYSVEGRRADAPHVRWVALAMVRARSTRRRHDGKRNGWTR